VKKLVTSTIKDQLAGLPPMIAAEVQRVTRTGVIKPAIVEGGVG
jgi:hypothetical protein